jgi:hypothetical protein
MSRGKNTEKECVDESKIVKFYTAIVKEAPVWYSNSIKYKNR